MAAASAEKDFWQEARQHYGTPETKEISDWFLYVLEDSQATLPVSAPLAEVKLGFVETDNFSAQTMRSVTGSAQLQHNGITITFERNAPAEVVIEDIPAAVRHEVAHIAHHQQNPQLFPGEESSYYWYRTILEGVATHAELQLLPNYIPSRIYPALSSPSYIGKRAIDEVLAELFYFAPENQGKNIQSYVAADKNFPLRAYVVGQYVVGSMAEAYGLDLQQLMTKTLGEFREFAETEL